MLHTSLLQQNQRRNRQRRRPTKAYVTVARGRRRATDMQYTQRLMELDPHVTNKIY